MERKKGRSAFLLLFFVKQNCKNKVTALDFVAHIFIGIQKKTPQQLPHRGSLRRASSSFSAPKSGESSAETLLDARHTTSSSMLLVLRTTLYPIPSQEDKNGKKRECQGLCGAMSSTTPTKSTHIYIYQVHRHAEIYISTGAPN